MEVSIFVSLDFGKNWLQGFQRRTSHDTTTCYSEPGKVARQGERALTYAILLWTNGEAQVGRNLGVKRAIEKQRKKHVPEDDMKKHCREHLRCAETMQRVKQIRKGSTRMTGGNPSPPRFPPWSTSSGTCFYILTSHFHITHPPFGSGPTTFSKIALSKLRDQLNSKSCLLISGCILLIVSTIWRDQPTLFPGHCPVLSLHSLPSLLMAAPSFFPPAHSHSIWVVKHLSKNELIIFLQNYHPPPTQIFFFITNAN